MFEQAIGYRSLEGRRKVRIKIKVWRKSFAFRWYLSHQCGCDDPGRAGLRKRGTEDRG